ncbi:MAG: hypothetical protein HDT18_08385 [Oscillibacter sp.]|nr:hypothetical protein [Oscillibacter sp.]
MKKVRWLLCALAALLLAGCSLAQPEENGSGGDRFAGFYLVHTPEYSDKLYDNPYLEEYGADSIKTDQFGTISFPREVLFAVEEEPGKYVFPGMEGGYSLFITTEAREYGPTTSIHSNMAPGKETNSTHVSDNETSYSVNGTVYYGPPLGAEDWDKYADNGTWTCYRVYQAEDGRVYMDGSGNSSSGGGGFGYGENQTQTTTDWNGETVTESIDVNVWVETVARMERLVVTQFDENNAVVRSDDLALREDLPRVRCEAETAWVLVEEISKDGAVRTAYNVPGEEEVLVSHMVILLDDEGLGKTAYLTIQ